MTRTLTLLAVVAALLAGCGDVTADIADEQTVRASAAPVAVEPEPEPEPEFDVPRKRDFQVDLKVLSKTCYGSGFGCDFEVRPDLTYLGLEEFDPSVTYELTFEVVGASEEMVSTIEITGDQFTADEWLWVTTDSNADPKAEVLSLEERGF